MSFREKVKAIVEEKTVTMAHPESQKKETQGSGGAIKVPHSEVDTYKAKGWVTVEKSKLGENSNHPFYQKVKELSRGNKKNKSLLEKKSKSVQTFKILLGTVDKKSKTDESLAGGAAQEVGAMGVRALAAWLKKRKSKTNEPAEDKKSKMVEAKKDGSDARDWKHDKGLTDMDPEAIRKQIEAETEEYEAMRAKQGKKPVVKPEGGEKPKPDLKALNKKHAPSERRSKPRNKDGVRNRVNNILRKLGHKGTFLDN